MLVVREMLPLLEASPSAKIINITSQLGSLERKTSGGDYSYCSSKAALNMLSRTLAADLSGRGIPVIVVHPGWVQTDMGGSSASLTPHQSAAGIIALLDKLTLKDTGKFFTWEGRPHPW
jgi:NAD(P)-dependent dehydrogenase (short-subunit alcohol dehydrogenase family)